MTSAPTVVIRADSSTAIGSGHVMRCATLAHELSRAGAKVTFLCREHPGNLIDWLRTSFDVAQLPTEATQSSDHQQSDCAQWLGASVDREIEEVSSILAKTGKANWLVVDHYALGGEWERALRPYAENILVIDDIANRTHDCDLLLDQNLYKDSKSRYHRLVPQSTKLLLGPDYALLRPEFACLRQSMQWPRNCQKEVRRIFVFMSGADPDNVTTCALEGIRLSSLAHAEIDVLTGSANPHSDEIRRLCKALPNAHHHRQTGAVAELMAAADLALGATGSASWERASLALPTIAVSLASNQIEIARTLAEVGALTWLGNATDVDSESWRDAIDELSGNVDARMQQSKVAYSLVDGLGVNRVVETMTCS